MFIMNHRVHSIFWLDLDWLIPCMKRIDINHMYINLSTAALDIQ